MANQYNNKIIYGGETLIDLTGDTVTAADILSGKTAHDKSGAPITGTCDFNVDATDATAAAAEVTGTMPNRGSVTGTISAKTEQYTVPSGYHDGSGKVSIASAEQAKIIATNIRQGVTILGVEGSMSGTEDMDIEPAKSVTPATTAQTVLPAAGYDGMAQVNVAAIPVTRTDNAQGGVTVTIAGS